MCLFRRLCLWLYGFFVVCVYSVVIYACSAVWRNYVPPGRLACPTRFNNSVYQEQLSKESGRPLEQYSSK